MQPAYFLTIFHDGRYVADGFHGEVFRLPKGPPEICQPVQLFLTGAHFLFQRLGLLVDQHADDPARFRFGK